MKILFVTPDLESNSVGRTALLRGKIAELHPETSISITLIDEAPPDEYPWESRVGATDLAKRMGLVGKADMVALPSLRAPSRPDGSPQGALTP